jgi:hypothetical protein
MNARRRAHAARGVRRQQRRQFHGHPSVDTLGAIENRAKQLRRAPQVIERQLGEQRFTGSSFRGLARDLGVVGAGADGFVEDGRVGREAGHAELAHVALEAAVIEHRARDGIEPQALAELAQVLKRVHETSSPE